MPIDFSYLDLATLNKFGEPIVFAHGSSHARTVTAIIEYTPINDSETGGATVATELTLLPHEDYKADNHWQVEGVVYYQRGPAEPDGNLVRIPLTRRNEQY